MVIPSPRTTDLASQHPSKAAGLRLEPGGLARAAGWALGFALCTLGAQALSDATGSWRFVRTAYAAGAWWQLLTAQWVHLGYAHAVANVTGMLVLLLGFRTLLAGRLQGLALLGGYVGVALVLALDLDCAHYAGASGALHGLLAGNALSLLWVELDAPLARNRARAVGGVLLLGLALKLLAQHFGADASAPGWLGFVVYVPAHEAGAAGGLVAALLARLARRRRPAHPGQR